MKQTLLTLAVAVVAVWTLSSCIGDVVYDKYKPTPVDGWERSGTLVFDVPKLRDSGRYRQEIGLRINVAYPFTGLSLLVERTIEPGHRVDVDTLNCRLYDSKGNALGDGFSFFQYDFILSDGELQKGDSLHVRVSHIMMREILPGVSDIGFRLVRK